MGEFLDEVSNKYIMNISKEKNNRITMTFATEKIIETIKRPLRTV
jgi:hypothetical protein